MKLIRLAPIAFLAACQMTGMDPVVSAYNGDSVSIQSPGLAPARPGSEEDRLLAQSICSESGKTARYASSRMVADATVEFLYLCV